VLPELTRRGKRGRMFKVLRGEEKANVTSGTLHRGKRVINPGQLRYRTRSSKGGSAKKKGGLKGKRSPLAFKDHSRGGSSTFFKNRRRAKEQG